MTQLTENALFDALTMESTSRGPRERMHWHVCMIFPQIKLLKTMITIFLTVTPILTITLKWKLPASFFSGSHGRYSRGGGVPSLSFPSLPSLFPSIHPPRSCRWNLACYWECCSPMSDIPNRSNSAIKVSSENGTLLVTAAKDIR